jgi:hypothetical protein
MNPVFSRNLFHFAGTGTIPSTYRTFIILKQRRFSCITTAPCLIDALTNSDFARDIIFDALICLSGCHF